MVKQRLLLISLDGLGPGDLPHVFRLLPETAKLLQQLHYAELNCAPLTSAQAIWAELLTGRYWYENGCAGFSRPRGSLQKLEIFTEDDLLAPVTLLSGRKDVVVNVPLLKPGAGRDFLCDGSTPVNEFVKLTSPLQDEFFQRYRPRPFASAINAVSHTLEAFGVCIDVERVRMHCAMSLADKVHD